jgi:hypothetical protein
MDVTELLGQMRLGEAVQRLKGPGSWFDAAAVMAHAQTYEARAERMRAEGQSGEARRLYRRAAALKGLCRHGSDPARMVAETELPEGYAGKILLVSVTGDGFEGMVCLRSGDAWHREILANTRAEILDLGFPGARVHALGGAWAGFEADGSIVIRGASDDFGCLDKELAARLIARAHTGRPIRIED